MLRIFLFLLSGASLPQFLATALQAQPMSTLTVDDGLSQGYVSAITCDKDGFIWAATLNGLNRYDGYTFQTWNEQENGLNSNFVLEVNADNRGLIWIYTGAGLQVVDSKTGQIKSLKCMEALQNDGYRTIFIDSRGRIWIALDNQLFYIELPDKWTSIENIALSAQLHTVDTGSSLGKINSIAAFGSDILLATVNGVYNYNDRIKKCSFMKQLPGGFVHGTWYDQKSGNLLVRYEKKLFALQNGVLSSWPLEIPVWNHHCNFISDGQRVYIVCQSGIYEWKEGGPVKLIDGIEDEIISATADHFGQIWLGTNARGLQIIKSQQSGFSNILRGTSIGGVSLDSKEQFWLPRRESPNSVFLYAIDKKTGKLGRKFSSVPNSGFTFLPYGGACILNSSNEIELLHEDASPVKNMNMAIPPGTFKGEVRSMYASARKYKVLVGDFWGNLLLFDLQAKSFRQLKFDVFPPENSGEIRGIIEDHYGNFWIGTPTGLIKASFADSTIQIIRADGVPGNTLSSEKINALYIDPKEPEFVWVGTARGLNRVEIKSGDISSFTRKDGLNDDFIYSMQAGKEGDLWLGTNHGLICFNRLTKQTIQYKVADGLPASEFNTDMGWRTSDSTLYFGTVNGMVYFNPFQMPAPPASPDVRIIGLEVNGQPLRLSDSTTYNVLVPYLHQLTLQPAENNLAFRFTVMDFFNSEKYNCRYMLAGADKDWRYAGSNNLITYSNLAPGDYAFMVSAGNGMGGWTSERTLKIRILPPWWNRWWAWAIWIKLTAIICWIIARVRKRINQMEMERLDAKHRANVEENKTRMFLNIAHEVRTPLTIILGMADEISETARPELSGKTELMQQSGRQLLNVVQQILDLAKLEAHRLELNPQYGDLSSFVGVIAEPFRPMLQSRNIDFILYLPYKPVMTLFDPQYLQPVISNLLSNAAKFTAKGGIITLHLSQEPQGKVSLSIEDTGIGIAPEHLSRIFDRFYQVEGAYTETSGTGIGLTYVSELVKAMNGEISVSSVAGVGSVFTIVLPAGKPGKDAPVQVWEKSPLPVPAPGETAEVLPVQYSTKPHVLIVEDNFEMSQFIRRALAHEYNTDHAINGVEGIELARSMVPDLIITDVMMPEMNGFEFCAAVKADPVTDHIPVIILTARAEDADRIEGLQQGADAYLAKPFSREVLRLYIRNLIASRNRAQMKLQAETAGNRSPGMEETPETLFVAAVYRLIAERYTHPDFGVDDMCRHFNMSNSQFHRKVSALLGYPPGDMIRRYRLEQGKVLLSAKDRHNISEVAYAIGFRDPNYFSQAFGKAYGQSPREYRKSIENEQKQA